MEKKDISEIFKDKEKISHLNLIKEIGYDGIIKALDKNIIKAGYSFLMGDVPGGGKYYEVSKV